jgi:hypothetical protein
MLTTREQLADAARIDAEIDHYHEAGEPIENLFATDDRLIALIAAAQRRADRTGEILDIGYRAVVDCTAEPDVPNQTEPIDYLRVQIGGATEKVPVVMMCAGTRVDCGRTLKAFVVKVSA